MRYTQIPCKLKEQLLEPYKGDSLLPLRIKRNEPTAPVYVRHPPKYLSHGSAFQSRQELTLTDCDRALSLSLSLCHYRRRWIRGTEATSCLVNAREYQLLLVLLLVHSVALSCFRNRILCIYKLDHHTNFSSEGGEGMHLGNVHEV
jgi:hypothetical protein